MKITLLERGPQPAHGESLPFDATGLTRLTLVVDVQSDMGQEPIVVVRLQCAKSSDGPWRDISGGLRLDCAWAHQQHRVPIGTYRLGALITPTEPWLRIAWSAQATRNVDLCGLSLVLGVTGEAT